MSAYFQTYPYEVSITPKEHEEYDYGVIMELVMRPKLDLVIELFGKKVEITIVKGKIQAMYFPEESISQVALAVKKSKLQQDESVVFLITDKEMHQKYPGISVPNKLFDEVIKAVNDLMSGNARMPISTFN